MSEQTFKNSIFKVAVKLKGSALTVNEQSEIVRYFNESKKSTDFERAKEAIEKVVGKNVPLLETFEKSAEASLDNLDDLLRLMRVEAATWNKE